MKMQDFQLKEVYFKKEVVLFVMMQLPGGMPTQQINWVLILFKIVKLITLNLNLVLA